MLKIELTGLDNDTLSKLIKYAVAANIPVDKLIEEIIVDAMLGNDIKGSLEDTIAKSSTEWQQDDIYIPKDTTKGYPTSGGVASKFRFINSDHQRDLQSSHNQQSVVSDIQCVKAATTSNAIVKPVHEDTPQSKPVAVLLQPKLHLQVEQGDGSSAGLDPSKVEALASKFGKVVSVSPAQKASELLKPQEQALPEATVSSGDIMYLSWLDDAVNAIKALPSGQKFVANQFLPDQATPEEARVFGKKLLQLITKYKLFSSKHKGKACMEYTKA